MLPQHRPSSFDPATFPSEVAARLPLVFDEFLRQLRLLRRRLFPLPPAPRQTL